MEALRNDSNGQPSRIKGLLQIDIVLDHCQITISVTLKLYYKINSYLDVAFLWFIFVGVDFVWIFTGLKNSKILIYLIKFK